MPTSHSGIATGLRPVPSGAPRFDSGRRRQQVSLENKVLGIKKTIHVNNLIELVDLKEKLKEVKNNPNKNPPIK